MTKYSANNIINKNSKAYHDIVSFQKTLGDIIDENRCDESQYPIILFPNSLVDYIDEFRDLDPDKYLSVGNIMNFIIKNGEDTETIQNDWQKYKNEPIVPTLYVPRPRTPQKKVAHKHEVLTKQKEEIKVFRPGGCLILSSLLFLILLVMTIANKDAGYILYFLLWIPAILLGVAQEGLGEKIKKTVFRKRSKEDIKRDEEKAEFDYQQQMDIFEEDYQKQLEYNKKLPTLIKQYEEEYEIEKEKFQKKIEEREDYWNKLPILIDKEFCRAFSCMILEKISTQVEYKRIDQENMPQKGATEDTLFYALMKYGVTDIKTDVFVNDYYPDIAIIGCGYMIDIEIDEPYTHKTKRLTHYIGCGDEERNAKFQETGAFVIRFSEEQITNNLGTCVEIVSKIQGFAKTGNCIYLNEVQKLYYSIAQDRWTKEDARCYMIEDSREKQKRKENGN